MKRLSPQQQKLLDLFVQNGWRNKQLAYALGISEGTAKVYFCGIFKIHGVTDRAELMASVLWPKIRALEAENAYLRAQIPDRAA